MFLSEIIVATISQEGCYVEGYESFRFSAVVLLYLGKDVDIVTMEDEYCMNSLNDAVSMTLTELMTCNHFFLSAVYISCICFR